MKSEDSLKEILDTLKEFTNINYILGREITDVSNIDLVVVSPGVPLDTTLFDMVRKNNIKNFGNRGN